MAAKYVNITIEEMDAFLAPQGFVVVDLRKIDPNDNTREVVYGKRVDTDGHLLTLRIYTGIVAGESREVGADAIRVNIFTRKLVPDENTQQMVMRSVKIGGSKRVHRVVNWRKNLQERLDRWQENLKTCPKCGNLMKVRKGRNGEFLGCMGYPECRHTENLPKE
jgi:hypothetical protein